MKSVSIYALTRKQNLSNLSRLECHLSERDRPLKVRAWEINSMRALVDQLEKYMPEVYRLRLFYSFQILRLGKEFDLLQVKENQIVNIELKSGAVSEDAIRRQLIQNRYYLAILGRPVRSYTYISSQNRLVRLTNHDHIVEAEWEQLCAELQEKSADFSGDLEDLFQAEWYLISPLTQPERFLKKEYFLTAQQKDIERQILKSIRIKRGGYYHFSGLPGTGKTLLLYDIAMKLSGRQMVCMIQITAEMRLDEYETVWVDEAHLLDKETLENIVEAAGKRPVIFTSDCEDQLSPEEVDQSVKLGIAKLPEIQTFRLTNRIRTNEEISSFVQNMMHIPDYKSGRRFPHVTVFYANDDQEAANLIQDAKKQGYQHLLESEVAEKAYDSVAIILDGNYFYDSKKYLRSKKRTVRNLFHQLNSAKEKLMLIVKNNEQVYAILLGLL